MGSMMVSRADAAPAFAAPARLLCEYLPNPEGIGETSPRLSWIDTAADPAARGLTQSAYQILVASSPGKLAADIGDLWNSGPIASSKSSQIPYAGSPLASKQACFWKVRVWDPISGEPSPWSTQATWSMGILSQSEWTAQWIGRDIVTAAEAITNANWIWFSGESASAAPVATRWFSRTVTIPAGSVVSAATAWMTADDSFAMFVNGTQVLNGNAWNKIYSADITSALGPGSNVITVAASNGAPSPAGLIGTIKIVLQNGNTISVPTNSSWLSTKSQPANFAAAGSIATGWSNAQIVAPYGAAPWGNIQAENPYLPVTYLRKDFELSQLPARAVLFMTCLGNAEPRLNGKRVGEDYFVPGWTDYKKRLYYRAYDVTSQLRLGANTLGAKLADGWFRGNISVLGRNFYGSRTRFRAQLYLFAADGSSIMIPTDASWTTGLGPIREADMQAGETYDSRLEAPGWDAPGFAATGWTAPDTGAEVTPVIEFYPGAPVRRIEERPAAAVTTPVAGLQVFDFGQNFAGWVRLRVTAPAGSKIVMRFGEMLKADGTVYRDNLRSARATDTYICKGGSEEIWEPAFTYHGFQFVEVEGLPGPAASGTLTGVVVHSDLPRVGSFDSSNAIATRTANNMRTSIRSNSVDIPTDCPQRDERMGWMDYHEVARSAQYELDQSALFTKWMNDIMDARLANGVFSQISPDPHKFEWSPGWADSSVLIPWTMYLVQGDTRLAERWYVEMKSHVDNFRARSSAFIGPNVGYGDWLAPDMSTPKNLISTALFAHDAFALSEMARATGRTADAASYWQLFENIRSAFQARFVSPDGTIGSNSQGGYALAIAYDLLTESQQALAASRLVAAIEARSDHLSTGMVTTHLLLPALSKVGRSDVAYRLVNQTTFPSWGYFLTQGATSMWERWDSKTDSFNPEPMNSYNHANLGTCVEWFYHSVLGIDLLEPGFKRIQIKPTPGVNLTHASGHYDSPAGRIASDWRLEGDAFSLNVTIPPNTKAEVSLPAWSSATVREGDTEPGTGITLLREGNGVAVYEVGSGNYRFRSSLVMPAPEITSIGTTDTSAVITWTPVLGTSAYSVKRGASVNGPYETIATDLAATTYSDRGLSAATTYFYMVSISQPSGATLDSAAASATTSPSLENWRIEHFGTSENFGDAANTADPDGDGMTNEAEWSVRTDPKDATSVLKIVDIHAEKQDVVLTFTTAVGKTYRVESSASVASSPWIIVKDGIPGTGSAIELKVLTEAAWERRFYRITATP